MAESGRDEQFHQPGEMIPVDVGTEWDATVLEFPHPIQFSVECKMLQYAKQGNGEPQAQQEPDEVAPVSPSPIGLYTKKK